MAKATCSIEGCDGEVIARGWCQKHYSRWYTQGNPEATPRRPGVRPLKFKVCTVEGCDNPRNVLLAAVRNRVTAGAATGTACCHAAVTSYGGSPDHAAVAATTDTPIASPRPGPGTSAK